MPAPLPVPVALRDGVLTGVEVPLELGVATCVRVDVALGVFVDEGVLACVGDGEQTVLRASKAMLK